MCTLHNGESEYGSFTAVVHEFPQAKIFCVGEVDCKSASGEYIELKASSSPPQYWQLSSDQKVLFYASMYLGQYSKLVRGHQKVNKRYPNARGSNTLDILDEMKIEDLGLDDQDQIDTFAERLNVVIEKVKDEGVKYLISFDDEANEIRVTPQ
eukprot:TRINITY_DN3328_c0_g1_i3.p1 TRINITY_DN3328_c0_g1~~TRINITY_DN3328_c0_g1_i3.p1  ORF type:complete len:153 (-),score=18.92 TRINITY_DN3328_c0_g1_i3:91-549(-)